MYTVYKITNLVNNKIYIGSSVRVEKRWRWHINAANNKNASSYHINRISKKCAKVDKNENILEIYNSYHDAARESGYDGDNYASIIKNICEGKLGSSSLSKCIQGNSRYTHVGDYVFRELDLQGNIIEQNNITIKDIIETFEKRNPSINNERHTISEWCKIYNIKIATVNARIRKGWDSEKAITTPVKRSDA